MLKVASKQAKGPGAIFGSKLFWLLAGLIALLAGGRRLADTTHSFFVDTRTVTQSNFITGTVALLAETPQTVVFNFSKLVPGDVVSGQITITNPGESSAVTVPYYLTVALHPISPATTTATTTLDSNTSSGLRLAIFRCTNATGTAPVSCSTAQDFYEITGVTGGTARLATTGNEPNAAAVSVDGGDLVFSSTASGTNVTASSTVGTFAGRPILTAHNSNCNSGDGSTNACAMGGYVSGLRNPGRIVIVETIEAAVPSNANATGIAPGASDQLLVYVYLPTTADNMFLNQTQQFGFGFTAVQPVGVTAATTTYGTSGLRNVGTQQVRS